MNDHAAMTAINATLDQYFKGDSTREDTLNAICRISGENRIDHEEAK